MGEIITVQPIKEKIVEKIIKCHEAHFEGFAVAIFKNQIIILGNPKDSEDNDSMDDGTWHNCDQMGCGWEHVLMRINVDNVRDYYADIESAIKPVYEGDL
jgi:hypothetical protein